MIHPAFERLLVELRQAYAGHPVLGDFCIVPDDLTPQPITPGETPGARLMAQDTGLWADKTAALRDAFIAAGPQAQWRETYKGSHLGRDFMDRFACYCLIGEGGPFISNTMAAYLVYMPAGLYYPYHHHPAEELYLILAGAAEFRMEEAAPKTLQPGDHIFHPSNRPHATQTFDHPLMALVLWRGDLETAPVLTNPEGGP